MASPTKFLLTPGDRGVFHVGTFDVEAMEKSTELLQRNLENYDMMFQGRRHNHLAHHVLTAYALGASASQLEELFERNTVYQKPRPPIDEGIIAAMKDKAKFIELLDTPQNYTNFLVFFQRQINMYGVKTVLAETLFADNNYANEILARWYGGIIHPLLHMGFAMEFSQPALIAEALAQACVHEEADVSLLKNFMLDAESKSAGVGASSTKPLVAYLDQIRDHESLKHAHLNSGNEELDKIKTVLQQFHSEMVEIARQYTIAPGELAARMLEMVNVMSCSTSLIQPSPRPYRVDFFFMHSLNVLVLLPAIARSDWLSDHNKLRLFEWLGRYNIVLYPARGSPRITPQGIRERQEHFKDWAALCKRGFEHPTDDGHLIKIFRAIMFAKFYTEPLRKEGTLLVQDDEWLRLANMINDSVPDTALDSPDRWDYLPF